MDRTEIRENDYHVVPNFKGEPEHETRPDCWCEPDLDHENEDTGARLWVHKRPN